MNLKNVALLVNEDLMTAVCAFGHSDSADQYTYVGHKDLVSTLSVGDLVVVERMSPGNCGMTVLRVAEIHEESEIDPEGDFEYRWIIDKVEGNVDFLREEHEKSVIQLKTMRRKSYRQRLIEDFKQGVLLENDA